jgi:hypothetical protein
MHQDRCSATGGLDDYRCHCGALVCKQSNLVWSHKDAPAIPLNASTDQANGDLKVLITIREGFPEIFADPGVEVEIIDYDSTKNPEIPERFKYLLSDERLRQ